MHDEMGFEDLVLKNTTIDALTRFAKLVDWPPHLQAKYQEPTAQALAALTDYFGGKKADWVVADFLAQCTENEIPEWLRKACLSLKALCEPAPASDTTGSGAPESAETEPEAGTDATH